MRCAFAPYDPPTAYLVGRKSKTHSATARVDLPKFLATNIGLGEVGKPFKGAFHHAPPTTPPSRAI
jgi:hypothetical protein